MSIALRSVRSALVVLASVAVLSAACGGSSSGPAVNPASIKLAPAPDVGISLHVEGDQAFQGGVKSELASSMTAAGYKLIEGNGKAEVKATVKVIATEEASMFALEVNGKTNKTYKVAVAASFMAADGTVIDSAQTEFTSKGEVEAGALKVLLGQLSDSGKLVAWADAQKKKTAAAEDDLWKAANAEGCAAAKAEKDCDGVKGYIAKYPSGKHTADGRKALTDADASIVKGKEEEAWKQASIEQCLKPAKSYDCKAVEDFIAKYPSSAHVAEGKDAMKKTEKAREDFKKKETAQAKKASLEECIKECKREYRFASPYAFEILVARCKEAECK